MKLNQNTKYNTIAIYTVLVFAACLILFKIAFTWDDTTIFVKNIISIMTPFITALLVAYFLSPMINFFEANFLDKVHIKERYIRSAKIKRIISIIMSYLIVVGALSILLSIVIPQIADNFIEISGKLHKLPDYIKSLLDWAKNSKFTISDEIYILDLQFVDSVITKNIPSTLDGFYQVLESFVPNIINFTTNLATGFLNILFGFIIAIYLLFSKEAYLSSTRKVITALVPANDIESLFKTFKESHKIFSSFFIGKVIDSFIIGVLCFILMLIFKFPYAILISVIVGVTNMIPYFGPFIGGIIGFFFLLIATPVKALWFGLLVLGLQQLDGNVIGPKILGDSTGLTPFWVIFSIILFGSMFGFMGMFIGVPCFAVIKNIFDNVVDRRYRVKMAEHKATDTPDINYKL